MSSAALAKIQHNSLITGAAAKANLMKNLLTLHVLCIAKTIFFPYWGYV